MNIKNCVSNITLLPISILLAVALLSNSILFGQASYSTKTISLSQDLASQDKVVVKMTQSATSEINVSRKSFKIKEGTTVVWQNMLSERVNVQLKTDGGQLLFMTSISPNHSYQAAKLDVIGTYTYDVGNAIGSIRGVITVVELI